MDSSPDPTSVLAKVLADQLNKHVSITTETLMRLNLELKDTQDGYRDLKGQVGGLKAKIIDLSGEIQELIDHIQSCTQAIESINRYIRSQHKPINTTTGEYQSRR